MNVKVNFSHVHAIDKHINLTGSIDNVTAKGSKGYGSAFFKWGRPNLLSRLKYTG